MMWWEMVVLVVLTVARARGSAAAAETLRGGDECVSVFGVVVVWWLVL